MCLFIFRVWFRRLYKNVWQLKGIGSRWKSMKLVSSRICIKLYWMMMDIRICMKKSKIYILTYLILMYSDIKNYIWKSLTKKEHQLLKYLVNQAKEVGQELSEVLSNKQLKNKRLWKKWAIKWRNKSHKKIVAERVIKILKIKRKNKLLYTTIISLRKTINYWIKWRHNLN